jgi:hypothetical protein
VHPNALNGVPGTVAFASGRRFPGIRRREVAVATSTREASPCAVTDRRRARATGAAGAGEKSMNAKRLVGKP